MAIFINARRAFFGFILGYPFGLFADQVPLSQGTTTFSATLLEGSCDWSWSETALTFLPLTAEQITAGRTFEIKPLTASIQCSGAMTPQLKITGNVPFASTDRVFSDGSVTRRVGFMLQPDDGSQQPPALNTFYQTGIGGQAIANNTPFPVIAITSADQSVQQTIWVGLVGMAGDRQAIPGEFSTVLTFTGMIP